MNIANYLKKWIKDKPLFVKIITFNVKIAKIIIEHALVHRTLVRHNNTKIKVIKINDYKNIFCGYYDVTPFSPINNNLLLVHATNYTTYTRPSIDKEVHILLFDLLTEKYSIIDKTYAWNWQQGSRCQWLNGEWIAYNIISGGKVRCKIKNVVTNEEKICPVNLNISYKDQFIITTDYFSLTEGSEYGYPGLEEENSASCIQLLDLESNQVIKLFNWKESPILSGLMPSDAIRSHINHILPTLNGDGFIFIFRYWASGKRFDSLVYCEILTKKISVLIGNKTVSHYAWFDNNTLLAWLVFDGEPGYYMIDLQSKSINLSVQIGDGHPSHIIGDKFITDVHKPSWLGGNNLTAVILDSKTGEQYKLVSLSHPTLFDNGNRCDTHISLSKDNKRFQLDSMHLYSERTIIVGELE